MSVVVYLVRETFLTNQSGPRVYSVPDEVLHLPLHQNNKTGLRDGSSRPVPPWLTGDVSDGSLPRNIVESPEVLD